MTLSEKENTRPKAVRTTIWEKLRIFWWIFYVAYCCGRAEFSMLYKEYKKTEYWKEFKRKWRSP